MIGSLRNLVFLVLVTQVFSANILFLSGVASPSHHIFNRALVLGLAKNHNVTFVSDDISDKKHANIHYIHLEKAYDNIYGHEDAIDLLEMSHASPFGFISELYDFMLVNCEGNYVSAGFEKIINYPNDFKFDVVIHDITCGPCLLPLVHKFNYPPIIAITAFGIPPYTVTTIGGHKYPAYIPHYNLNFPIEMSFFQRFQNTLLYVYDIM